MEVIENQMAVQEARISQSRSRTPSQEIFKEFKPVVTVVDEVERTSLFEDFVSGEDSASEDSEVAQVQLPVKTPMPGQPQYFAQPLDARTLKTKEFVSKKV